MLFELLFHESFLHAPAAQMLNFDSGMLGMEKGRADIW